MRFYTYLAYLGYLVRILSKEVKAVLANNIS